MDRTEFLNRLQKLELMDLNLIVHAALPAFGPETSAVTICETLLEAVGPNGTIVMPAFTYSETLFGPDKEPIAFRPESPVSPEVGTIAETFRTLPGVLRSSHPSHSFASYGRHARDVLSTQRDNNPLGPIKKLNVLQGYVLLLGTQLRSATVCHLAEEMATYQFMHRGSGLRINAAGFAERVILENLPGCSVAFDRLEGRLDPEQVASTPLPDGIARKIPIRYLVRLASAALTEDPAIFICDRSNCESCEMKRAAIAGMPVAL
jgi:aminoglycoside N3'-acetyltransferase